MRLLARLLLVLLLCSSIHAQDREKRGRRYPPHLEGAQEEIFKTVGDVKLKLWIFKPADHNASDRRPAIVFFFGGGWRNGTPAQFEQHCRYLASRGMVAVTADYRVSDRHQVKAVDCVRDAKSAVRWLRKESQRLGIDPQRIAAGGGSAGGHLAAATALISDFDETSEDAAISSRPNALVLFNPALVLAAIDGAGAGPRRAKEKELDERMGVEPKKLSPFHHVSANSPPTIIFHGKDDSTVPYRSAEAFSAAMAKSGNRCELIGYEGQEHGFFNYGRGGNRHYRQTTRKMDEFLASLGYLSGSPTVEAQD